MQATSEFPEVRWHTLWRPTHFRDLKRVNKYEQLGSRSLKQRLKAECNIKCKLLRKPSRATRLSKSGCKEKMVLHFSKVFEGTDNRQWKLSFSSHSWNVWRLIMYFCYSQKFLRCSIKISESTDFVLSADRYIGLSLLTPWNTFYSRIYCGYMFLKSRR